MFWSEKYRDDFADARDEGRAEGREEGRAEGRAEEYEKGRKEFERTALLGDELATRGRSSELVQALHDAELRKRLFEEFGIGTGKAGTTMGSNHKDLGGKAL